MTDRLVLSLAERLYTAHYEWAYSLSENAAIWPRWFALREDIKSDYIGAAEALLESEKRRMDEQFNR